MGGDIEVGLYTCLSLCFGFAVFGWVLGWVSNSDKGDGDFM